jgi:glutamine synthetase
MSLPSFVQRADQDSPARQLACQALIQGWAQKDVDLVRLSWCDQHGGLRTKALTTAAAAKALEQGITMVGTVLLKDSADKTAYAVFEPGAPGLPEGFAGASNLILLPDPASYRLLPWAPRTGWLRCQAFFPDGRPVGLDTRYVLQKSLRQLATKGYGLRCGLEIEFHIYRLIKPESGTLPPEHNPLLAEWPGLAPQVEMIHPGYHLLSELWLDRADEALQIVRDTALGLGLPLISLEIELGPSQVEAVFDVTDALQAADNMVLFRSAITQALLRKGYMATFMCRPPFPNIMSSGWHLHQSLSDLKTGTNAYMRASPAVGSQEIDAHHTLSEAGCSYLAGLLDHADAVCAFSVPTVNGYTRFRPKAMAPMHALWGKDNRGAMLRVIGQAQDPATRIENRVGEPAANPYLTMAAQIAAGANGWVERRKVPPATLNPYDPNPCSGGHATALPRTLLAAIQALDGHRVLRESLGDDLVNYFCTLKRAEWQRFQEAPDPQEWQRREYFSRG